MKDYEMTRASQQTQELIAAQAAQWVLTLDGSGGTEDARRDFGAWLRTSPVHVHEFLNARAVWEAFAGKACAAFPDSDTLLREVRETGPSNIVALIDATPPPTAPMPRKRAWLSAAAAASVLLCTGLALWLTRADPPEHALYQTAVGEQATYTLPDGSTIWLNTNSRVRLNWSGEFRDVRLEEGETLFQVARDVQRPFRVWSGRSMVRALGTRFNVYRNGDATTVTVLEGRVEVTRADAARVQLGAGEQARIRQQQPIRTARLAAPERSVAWQSRRLMFESEPLSEVIRQFNRYHDTPLVLEDADLGAKRVNGVFDATDRASLVAFLKEFEDVEIEARPREIVIRRR